MAPPSVIHNDFVCSFVHKSRNLITAMVFEVNVQLYLWLTLCKEVLISQTICGNLLTAAWCHVTQRLGKPSKKSQHSKTPFNTVPNNPVTCSIRDYYLHVMLKQIGITCKSHIRTIYLKQVHFRPFIEKYTVHLCVIVHSVCRCLLPTTRASVFLDRNPHADYTMHK